VHATRSPRKATGQRGARPGDRQPVADQARRSTVPVIRRRADAVRTITRARSVRQAASDGLAAGAPRSRQSAHAPTTRKGRLLRTFAAFGTPSQARRVGERVVVGPLRDRPVRPEQRGEQRTRPARSQNGRGSAAIREEEEGRLASGSPCVAGGGSKRDASSGRGAGPASVAQAVLAIGTGGSAARSVGATRPRAPRGEAGRGVVGARNASRSRVASTGVGCYGSRPLPWTQSPMNRHSQSQPPRRPPRRRVVGRVHRHGPAFRRRPRPDLVPLGSLRIEVPLRDQRKNRSAPRFSAAWAPARKPPPGRRGKKKVKP
jgi:hypothetical protein